MSIGGLPLEEAYFLGPKSENAAWFRSELQAILDHWFDWRRALFRDDPSPIPEAMRLTADFLGEREVFAQRLRDLRDMLCDEVPKYTPRYIGHMVSEVSLPALLGHFAALLHNPNNTSREVARVSGPIEDEAISMLAGMVGYDPDEARGHFTSGGTIANFECIWRARYRLDHFLALGLLMAERTGSLFDPIAAAHMGWEMYRAGVTEHGFQEGQLKAASGVLNNPFELASRISKASRQDWKGPVLLVPGNKHFSWLKAANVFGLGQESFWSVALDRNGRMDVAALRTAITKAHGENRPVLAVVSVAGTTEAGEIDPIDRVCDLLDELGENGIDIWHHVDAAWGGFLCSMLGGEAELSLHPAQRSALTAIRRADSVTLDPHKLGYVPYACGAFLVADAVRYANSRFAAPYIDRALPDDRWMVTLEGSRSGAGASAVWLTGKTLTFTPDRFGRMLAETIESRDVFGASLTEALPDVRLLEPADSNILCFSIARDGEALSESNARTAKVHARFVEDPAFSVSKTVLGEENYDQLIDAHLSRYGGQRDCGSLVLLRCVFMNPFWSHDGVRAALTPEFIQQLETHTN